MANKMFGDLTYGESTTRDLQKKASNVPINTRTGSYTLTLADEGKLIRMNTGSPNVVTIPNNTSVALPIGTSILVRQAGAGQTTIEAAGEVTINATSLDIAGQHQSVVLIKVSTNEWDLYGGGVASSGNTTPAAPLYSADDTANTLSFSHALGNSEIVVSTNNGSYLPYTGPISVGDVARAAGYYKAKIKAATGRNESAVTESPAFTVGADTTAPNLTSKVVENATPGKITLTYSEALQANASAPIGQFSVSGGRTISFVEITGNEVHIFFSPVVANGDVVTVSYSGSSIKDTAGNLANTFTNSAVTNNVAAPAGDGSVPLTAWSSLSGISLTGNNIVATGDNAYGVCDLAIQSGDGYAEYELEFVNVGGDVGTGVLGLDAASGATPGINDLDFFFYGFGMEAQSGQGGIGSSVPVANGDILRLERSGTSMLYKKNGTTIKTVTGISATDVLYIKCWIYKPGFKMKTLRGKNVA